MFPADDRHWVEVRDYVRAQAGTQATIMAPVEFLEFFPNAYHYHVDVLLPLDMYDLVLVHKGMLDQLAPGSLAELLARYVPVMANEVFVVLGRGKGISWWRVGMRRHAAPLAYAAARDSELSESSSNPSTESKRVAVVVCAYNRPLVLARTLPRIVALGAPTLVVVDGVDTELGRECEVVADAAGAAVMALPQNRGLPCATNAGLAYWLADPSVEWISLFEDDAEVRPRALEALAGVADAVSRPILTGYQTSLHPTVRVQRVNGVEVHLQRSAPGVHLHGHRDYWTRVMPIPSPYLGAPKPSGGRPGQGSDSDWWITAWAPDSVVKQGGYVACVPGLVEHPGTSRGANSTW